MIIPLTKIIFLSFLIYEIPRINCSKKYIGMITQYLNLRLNGPKYIKNTITALHKYKNNIKRLFNFIGINYQVPWFFWKMNYLYFDNNTCITIFTKDNVVFIASVFVLSLYFECNSRIPMTSNWNYYNQMMLNIKVV